MRLVLLGRKHVDKVYKKGFFHFPIFVLWGIQSLKAEKTNIYYFKYIVIFTKTY